MEDWNVSKYILTLSPYGFGPNYIMAISAPFLGVTDSTTDFGTIVVPTVFLKADVIITGGTGAKTDPYIAALP